MAGRAPLLAAAIGFVVSTSCMVRDVHGHDYRAALTLSLLYFEVQRSGKLPPSQRVQWRGDSALGDGGDHRVDLTGGYYDAGDNVKFGFPMAFTVTTLSWSVVEYRDELDEAGELTHARDAVRWGADYLARAHTSAGGADVLYVQVGDGDSDHSCWQRPEDMDTPRTAYMVNASSPGSDVAAETAAALAAAAVALTTPGADDSYASTLLGHAKQLFEFAKNHRGLYHHSVPSAAEFYASSGDEDELLWAAAWLYIATGGEEEYKAYITGATNLGGVRSEFSWDDKFVGVQALVAKLVLQGKLPSNGSNAALKTNLEQFICNVVQHSGGGGVRLSPGGMLWWNSWNNMQYVTLATLVLAVHADHLTAAKASLQCSGAMVSPAQLTALARSQVDYILGTNPETTSYMIGYGSRYPVEVHHRAASVPSIKADPMKVTCKGGFDYYNKNSPNPNVIAGAIVGGPDADDQYSDSRQNFQQAEPATVTVAPIVGVLARLSPS